MGLGPTHLLEGVGVGLGVVVQQRRCISFCLSVPHLQLSTHENIHMYAMHVYAMHVYDMHVYDMHVYDMQTQ